jgi:hypothetical protein
MEWKFWPIIPLKDRANLPAQPGIYVVVDTEDEVWYVGLSVNIKVRWNGKSHHRYQQISRTNNKRQYKICWQIFPISQLKEQEQKYINLFKPHLNYSRVKTYAKKSRKPSEEISRLLKVINKKTTLFPDVRSLVVGYYTEIDEDEAGCLKEFFCIVIAVTVNDHDGPILNSYNKSWSKKGEKLKEVWKIYEADYKENEVEEKPALIPVFIFENIIYEFVSCPRLIAQIRNYKDDLFLAEVASQNILALKNMDSLVLLDRDNKKYLLRSEKYLHYRAQDLRPIWQLMSELPSP